MLKNFSSLITWLCNYITKSFINNQWYLLKSLMSKFLKNNSGFRRDNTFRKKFKNIEHHIFALQCLKESEFPTTAFVYLQNTVWLSAAH